jgi:hypothetical protein
VEDTKSPSRYSPTAPLHPHSTATQKGDGREALVVLHVGWYTANLQAIKALREERRMDFNTGSSGGRPDDESRPLYGGDAGGPTAGGSPRGPAGGSAREFNLQDPVGSFISTVRNVVLNPVDFFRGIPKQGNFVNPLVFALICYEISTILGGLFGLLLTGFLDLADAGGSQDFGFFGGVGGFFGSLIIAPIIGAIILFIFAGLIHLLTVLIIGSRNSGFEATFRAISYSFVYHLVSWIPIVGFLAGIYGLVLSIFGIREVHATTTGKAAAVVLIPVAVLVLIGILLAAVAGAFIFTLMQQQ